MTISMIRKRLLTLMLAIVILAPAGASVSAQSTANPDQIREQAEAAQALQEVFGFASARDFNQMYDSMHPDSRAAVPRDVAINLFADVYSSAIASEAIITAIELQSWTWPVNGVTYSDAAAITVIMPVVDDQGAKTWVEDTWYLVREDSAWYWFLGTSQEFIDQINATYAGDVGAELEQAGTLADVPRDDFIEVVVNYIDAFFREAVADTGYRYESLGFVVVPEGQSTMSACGPATTGFYGFYCPVDSTIYLDEPFLLGLHDQGADFAAAFVIAHEWSHHVQSGIGFDRVSQPSSWNQLYSIELELMADCFAGVWAYDADSRGILEQGDIEEAINLIVYQLGDPKFVGELDPQSHGTGEQRVRAFMNGYEQGFGGCNIKI